MGLEISQYFSEKEIEAVTADALPAEQSCRLTASMLALAREKKLFHLFVPQAYGGMQCELPEALRWLEAASWLDGSFGWTLTFAAGAGVFGAYMNPALAKKAFADDELLISGSGFPGGKAEATEEGYRIHGQWRYASGIDNATLITASCFISQNGAIQQENGEPVVKAVAFYPEEVSLEKDWNSYGLRATGSHNFKVTGAAVPAERIFTIAPPESKVEGMLYRYPFEPFAHCTLAVSMLGIAGRFLHESVKLLLSRNNFRHTSELPDPIRLRLSGTRESFHNARKSLYDAVDNSWKRLLSDTEKVQPREVIQQSRLSCEKALNSAQRIYPLLGMSAINPDSTVNRIWRDLHTVSQHMFLRPQD